MTLDEARRILESQDTTDIAKALLAASTVLRFHGISDDRLVKIAEDLESVAEHAEQRKARTKEKP